MRLAKTTDRLLHVIANTAAQFLPSLSNLLCSMFIIRLMQPEWWGEITIMQLYMYIAVQICSWGNKDLLMLEFSQQPAMAEKLWISSFWNRSILLLPALALTIIVTHALQTLVILCFWIVCRYILQAYEVIILYKKNFLIVIFSEIINILLTISLLFMQKDTNVIISPLLCMSAGFLAKTLIQTLYFKSWFHFNFIYKPNWDKLKTGLPFMTLGFAGVMLQKTDMICMSWFANKLQIAQYQVYSSFILLMQSFPGIIAGPFIKNVYRISNDAFIKFKKQFVLSGFLITIVLILITYIIITHFYHFQLSLLIYLLGFLYGILTYFYMLEIYLLYKLGQQKTVMWVSFTGVFINLVTCFILIPFFNMEGAVAGNVISQFSLLLFFKFYYAKYAKNHT